MCIRDRAERRPQRLVNAGGDPVALGLPAGYPLAHSAVIAPIVSLSFSYGWLCLANKLGADAFSADDEKVLAILGAQVGRIYENGSLYLEIQQHADQLQVQVQERQRAMDALRANKASLRRAQALAKISHVISGPDGAFESWLDTLPDMLGPVSYTHLTLPTNREV